MRRRFAAVVASAALVAVLLVPSAAYATITKCVSNFCAHVEGTGSHVAWVRMQVTLNPGQRESASFDMGTPDEPLGAANGYYRTTKIYHFRTAADAGFAVAHLTAHYYVNRSFTNNTRFCVNIYPRGNRHAHSVCVTIRS